ncbi:MAG: Ig-like domain-containing protein [Syntrophomonadaceae bacterium]|mgnify:CR=1 FL=1
MKRKVLTSIFCLIFLFSMTAMAFGVPQNGYYVNGHRYDLTLTKTDAAYQTYLSDMEAIDWDFSKVIIVTNNSFTNVHAAVNEDSIPGTLQPDAHQQVGSAIPSTIVPIANDGTAGAAEPVSNSPTVGAVSGVSLDKDTLSLTAGGAAVTLVATVSPADATNKNVIWSSSNKAVATVANGVVTPVAAGSATITVTTADGGFTANCAVTVSAATIKVTGVSLDKNALNLTAGGATGNLVATVTPSNATNKNVTWSSSNESVATVANGVVTPVAAGSASITVKTEDGNFTATCAVTVAAATIKVTGVSLDKNSLNLTAGGATGNLVATVTPSNATNKNVTWSSSNESVATVANGVVTPVAAGSASITVKTEDGSFTATCAVTVEAATVAVTGVSLNASTLTLSEGGDTAALVATVSPADATNKNVTWSSSNESVATVADGVVTPVAAGSATITVTTEDGKKTATCAVTVEAAAVPATPTSLISNAIANFAPVTGTVTFTGIVKAVKVVGDVKVNDVTVNPGSINSSKTGSSSLTIDIDQIGTGNATAATFPMYEIIAGPEATGTNLVSNGVLTDDANNYYITLTGVNCPQSLLTIISTAANINSKFAMNFADQKLNCKIVISKATGRIISVENFKIVGKTNITKSTLNMANGTYDNEFNGVKLTVNY